MNYQKAYVSLSGFKTDDKALRCSVLYQISQLEAECLLIEQAQTTVEKCLALASGDTLLSLKQRIMAKVRLMKKTGFFVEALAELDTVEADLSAYLQHHTENSQAQRLLIKVFRERMQILATVNRFSEAQEAYETIKVLEESFASDEWSKFHTDYLQALYCKPQDQQRCIDKLQ